MLQQCCERSDTNTPMRTYRYESALTLILLRPYPQALATSNYNTRQIQTKIRDNIISNTLDELIFLRLMEIELIPTFFYNDDFDDR